MSKRVCKSACVVCMSASRTDNEISTMVSMYSSMCVNVTQMDEGECDGYI